MKPILAISITASLLAFALPAYAQQGALPDPQMKAVLDELATLGGKPIETLSPEEARKQLTPAEAVAKLTDSGFIATPRRCI